ncbi:glycoside hydrolase family 65 protein [Salirhabdus salicampi]|uniref:glycoside hydrolase family 65 protein n=1 Tax=Salirhabdus salicampi TaxID=476102 RepID=UPI0020C5947E|nr:glycosyl hydrolase family 65 protein [Salirhabdus salicampi]MCP8617874.1 glycoside hydrolase family 65 protein [Salirhabdus salicampi]
MLSYNLGSGENRNWVIAETEFNSSLLGKCETIMALGNGYMGVRSSTEESYVKQTRNLFVAGTFNRFDQTEPSELPNTADVTALEINLNGEQFSLDKGTIHRYYRYLHLKTGELVRVVDWESPKKERFELTFRRFISLKNLHLIGMRVDIKPLSEKANIQVTSGINGQMTNSGAQHFHEGEKRIFDKKFLQLIQTTTETNIDFVINATHRLKMNHEEIDLSPQMSLGRRRVDLQYSATVAKDKTYTVEKLSTVHTSRDSQIDSRSYDLEELRKLSLDGIQKARAVGYEQLFEESKSEWLKYWNQVDIQINSENEIDQLAVRFASYHLLIMTPHHDSRFGIGAKGLTGEGYKGHSFWDSEIFILPYFLYTKPEIARSLLEYRYHTIDGARKKAKDNGYDGAMYPWESAFTGEEETPLWAAVNILTGKATKVWSGIIEQHITADIAFAVWNYYTATQDVDFMNKYGSEILFETATFWASRVEWDDGKEQYIITDVVGPDEYKEHVDNNAFTNYLAHWTIQTAIRHYDECKTNRKNVFERLNDKLSLEEKYKKWKQAVDHIYLPVPRESDNLIPQDDTYLSKPIIDITKYKTDSAVQTILQDFSREQVIDMQVSKQADVVMLLYLLGDRFSDYVKKVNLDYYESRTIHDSSLSMAVHSIVAANVGDVKDAYEYFTKASLIDLGENMESSDAGVHAASLGGIWKAVVFGFAGIKLTSEVLMIKPNLPEQWNSITIPIYWRGDRLTVELTLNSIMIRNETGNNPSLPIEFNGTRFSLQDVIELRKVGKGI